MGPLECPHGHPLAGLESPRPRMSLPSAVAASRELLWLSLALSRARTPPAPGVSPRRHQRPHPTEIARFDTFPQRGARRGHFCPRLMRQRAQVTPPPARPGWAFNKHEEPPARERGKHTCITGDAAREERDPSAGMSLSHRCRHSSTRGRARAGLSSPPQPAGSSSRGTPGGPREIFPGSGRADQGKRDG